MLAKVKSINDSSLTLHVGEAICRLITIAKDELRLAIKTLLKKLEFQTKTLSSELKTKILTPGS